MINKRDFILWLTFGWPTLIQGYFLACFGLLFRKAEKPRFEGVFLATDKRRWKRNAHKPIKYTTTLASWINYGPYADEATRWHEKEVHGMQYLTLNVLAALIGGVLTGTAAFYGGEVLSFAWRFSLILWAFSGFLWFGVDYLISTVRYKGRGVPWETVYFRTDPEQAAYARTEAEFDKHRGKWEKR